MALALADLRVKRRQLQAALSCRVLTEGAWADMDAFLGSDDCLQHGARIQAFDSRRNHTEVPAALALLEDSPALRGRSRMRPSEGWRPQREARCLD
jgi:hypothetical protein